MPAHNAGIVVFSFDLSLAPQIIQYEIFAA